MSEPSLRRSSIATHSNTELRVITKKFYDKIKNAKAKGMPFDPAFYEQNLLRFEVSYKSALKQQLGYFPSVENISIENNYNNLIDRWKQEFEVIRFNSVPYLSSTIRTANDFRNFCA